VVPRGIGSLDEIDWGAQRPGDDELMRRVRAKLGAEVGPPITDRDQDGYRVVRWVLQAFDLIRREMRIDAIGRFRREDVVEARDLPRFER
jgi:hypothetical protein